MNQKKTVSAINLEKLQFVLEASLLVNSSLELKYILKLIIDFSVKACNAVTSSLMLVDQERQELYFDVVEGTKEKILKEIRIPITSGIAGWVAQNGKSILIKDAYEDPRFNKEVDKKTGFRTKSILCVPLKVKDKVIGVVQVLNSLDKESFDESDLEVLTALAGQAAVAIENARLYEALKKEYQNTQTLKNYLASILKSAPEAVMVFNENNEITIFNDVAEKFFDKKEIEIINKKPAEIFNKEITKAVEHLLVEAKKENFYLDYECQLKKSAAEIIPLGLSTAALLDENAQNKGVVIVGRDLTQAKRLGNLEELNKMKSEFVSIVSHELRTPLTSIKGFISTLLHDAEGFFDEAQKQRFYQIISNETDRLIRLINDLLNVSRIEAGKALQMNIKEIKLLPIAQKAIETQKSYATKHHLKLEIDNNIEKIFADEDKLEQMLTNLLNNSIKYSPEGGKVILKITRTPEKEILFAISDEGLGIPANLLPKLFEKFNRVDREQIKGIKGTGIGLNLVKHLVELHQGKIWVESIEGKGSTFYFTIPEKLK